MGGATKPFIVQCEKCNKVLSDTTALVLSDKERNILVVKGASNIVVNQAGSSRLVLSTIYILRK